MIGAILLSFALSTSAISMVSYALALRNGDERYLKVARAGFHATVIAFMCAAAALLFFILTHQFQYTYVHGHSSKNTSLPLLFASFYAGQEGSFMLWTLWVALIGVFVLGYTQRVGYEKPVMAAYMLVVSCLLLILVVKSPFETIYATETARGNILPANFIPNDGKGLNPVLENIWITIHPPILFSGFAAMTVPFVFAIAGLYRRDYQRWITISLPWTLFATMVLGFGIMLGGWWAYETLGWGGFWAWDPVENSSLLPWLVCVALVHSMLVQKRTGGDGPNGKIGGLVKTNFILAILAFGMVLYSTFLTRSGVLGDTSVHSFVTPGNFVYAVLLGIIFLFMGLGFGLLVTRWKELHQASLQMKLMSRENALGIGSLVLLFSAGVVFIGTSWPIFMPLFGKPKVAIDVAFYNNLQLPLAIAITLINGISMTLKWKNTSREEFFKKIGLAVVLAAVGTFGLTLLGVRDPIFVALAFSSLLAMIVNVQIGASVLRGNPRFVGAYVSHAGVALMMLGIIFTARYSETSHVRLVQGKPETVFGYTATYHGPERIDAEKTDRETYRYKITLEREGSVQEVYPVIFFKKNSPNEPAVPTLQPGILYTITRDIYLAPKSLDQEGGDPSITLKKGDRAPIPFDTSMSVRFEKFDMSRAQREGMQGAVVEVATKDTTMFITAYRGADGSRIEKVTIPSTDVTLSFDDINVVDRADLAKSEAIIGFSSKSHPPGPVKGVITLDVSIKPYISFVWIGVIVMVGGFFFSILRRRGDLKRYLTTEDAMLTGDSNR